MPRQYSEGIPAGDPSNPLSLMTPGIDLPTVQFTAQDRVVEPENQFEKLYRILNMGSAAAAEFLQTKENQVRNQMAVDGAIERAKEIQQQEIEQDEKERERKIKLYQDGILNKYDSEITYHLLRDEYDQAQARAEQFSKDFPAERDPYMASKAMDQRLRVKGARKTFETNQRIEESRISAATQGMVVSDIIKGIETLQARLANPETIGSVMEQYEGVPNEELHTKMVEDFWATVPQSKRELLTPEDEVDITTTMMLKSDAARTTIIRERNKAATYLRYEQLGKAAVNTVVSMDALKEQLPDIFTYFDQIEGDRQAGLLSDKQARSLETELVSTIATYSLSETPVIGGMQVRDEVYEQMLSGTISVPRGNQILARLEKRIEKELAEEISSYRMNATAQAGEDNVNFALAVDQSMGGQDPGIAMGIKYGVLRYTNDGQIEQVDGVRNAKLMPMIQALSRDYQQQREAYKKENELKTDVDFINNIRMTNFTYDVIRTSTEDSKADWFIRHGGVVTPEGVPNEGITKRENNVDNLLQRELVYSIQYSLSGDMEKAQQHRMAGYSIVQKELQRPENQGPLAPEYETMMQELRSLNPVERAQRLQEMLDDYMRPDAQGKQRPTNRKERKFLLQALGEFNEETIPESIKRSVTEPSSMLKGYDTEEFMGMAESSSARLLKNRDKISEFDRSVEEERVITAIRYAGKTPPDFMKYIADQYMAAGASPDSLRRGYDLMAEAIPDQLAMPQYDANGKATGKYIYYSTPTMGRAEAEIAMMTSNSVLGNTIMMAQAYGVKFDQDPRLHLERAHREALRIEAFNKSVTDRRQIAASKALPKPQIDQFGVVIGSTDALATTRYQGFRKALTEIMGVEIPQREPSDFSFSMDIEDEMRYEAIWQLQRNNYKDALGEKDADEVATYATIALMRKSGYKPFTGPKDSTDARLSLILDPFDQMPDNFQLQAPDFREYLKDKVQQSVQAGRNKAMLDPISRGVLYQVDTTQDLVTPNQTIPVRLIDLTRGIEIEIKGEFGINKADYLQWRERARVKADADRPGI